MILFLSLCYLSYLFLLLFWIYFSVPFVISGDGSEFITLHSFCLSAFKARDVPPSAAVIALYMF